MILKFHEKSNHFDEIRPLPVSKQIKSEINNDQWSISGKIALPKDTAKDPRQNRCDLKQKAEIIAYMSHRESEEDNRSNATWYAKHIGVSRATIYNVYNEFKEKFQNDLPGPKPSPAEKVVEKLQKELRDKKEEFKILEELIEERERQIEEEKKRRLVATLLQAAVCPVSAREIRDLLETAFGVRLSKRKIKKLIAEYSTKARNILEEMDMEQYVEMLAIDEVFAGHNPILTGVEMNSFAVLICKKETNRTHVEWYQVLGAFPHLKLVVSDKATGIIKAVHLRGEQMMYPLLHQFDIFHFKRDVGSLIRHLEASAYRKIDREYQAQAQLDRAKTEEQRSTRHKQYQECKEKALDAIEIFDATEDALIKVYKSLEIFDEEGKFNDISSNLKCIEKESMKLKKIAERLPEKSKDQKDMESVARQLRDPRLFLFLIQLETRLLNIMCRWTTPWILRKDAIKILAEYWYWEVRAKKNQDLYASRKRLGVIFQVYQIQIALANFDDVSRQVFEALNAACKASSLVESFNSHVRIYQQVKKGLHKNFLYLMALKWNMTPFEDGKRKGKSPCQILGVPLKSSNWLELLLSA